MGVAARRRQSPRTGALQVGPRRQISRLEPFRETTRLRGSDGVRRDEWADEWYQCRFVCTAFGRDDWLADERLGTNNDRITERHWLHDAVAEMIAESPRAEVTARLDKAGVPFSPIARPEDLYDDPQLNDGLGLLETTLPAGVTAKLPRIPLEMGNHDFGLRRNPPQIGEDSVDLLKDVGYTDEQIAALVDGGVVAVEG